MGLAFHVLIELTLMHFLILTILDNFMILSIIILKSVVISAFREQFWHIFDPLLDKSRQEVQLQFIGS